MEPNKPSREPMVKLTRDENMIARRLNVLRSESLRVPFLSKQKSRMTIRPLQNATLAARQTMPFQRMRPDDPLGSEWHSRADSVGVCRFIVGLYPSRRGQSVGYLTRWATQGKRGQLEHLLGVEWRIVIYVFLVSGSAAHVNDFPWLCNLGTAHRGNLDNGARI